MLTAELIIDDANPLENSYLQLNNTSTNIEILDYSKDTLSEDTLNKKLSALVVRPYDIHNNPLIHHYLIKLSEERWYTVLACHHLLLDGASLTVHAYHLVTNYLNLLNNRATSFAEDNYADFVKNHFTEFDRPASIHYWQQRLKNLKPLQTATYTDTDHTIHSISHKVDEVHFKQVDAFCKKQHITVAIYYKCLYALLIEQYCQADGDFIIGEFNAGRNRNFMTSMGCHYYRQLFYVDKNHLQGSLCDWFKAVKQEKKNSDAYQKLSLRTQNRLMPEANLSFSYNYLSMPKSEETEGIAFNGKSYLPELENNIDLRVQPVTDNSTSQLNLILCYQKNLFSELRFLERLQHLSQQILNGSDDLTTLSYLLNNETSNDQHTIENNKVTRIYHGTDVFTQIHQQCQKTPDSIAIIDDVTQWRYSQLHQQVLFYSQALSALPLSSKRLSKNSRIGLCLKQNRHLIAMLLAIIHQRASYIPLDINNPPKRLRHMIDNANIDFIIYDDDKNKRLNSLCTTLDVAIFSIDELSSKPLPEPKKNIIKEHNTSEKNAINDMFYSIYTSGSTGTPKAASVSYANINHLIQWYTASYGLNHHDRCLLMSATSFDLTQKNFFALLTQGGTVVLSEQTDFDPDYLCEKIQQHRISYINCAPSALYALLDADSTHHFKRLNHLNHVMLGGETIKLQRLAAWVLSKGFSTNIINMYGPTECTDISSARTYTPQALKDKLHSGNTAMAIGNAITHVDISIANTNQQALPAGIAGEIIISGKNVGLGYYSKDTIENASFINKGSKSTYLSGDIARYSTNGELFFIGRKDQQIKLRGQRIDLHEINHALMQLTPITDAYSLIDNEQLLSFVISDNNIIHWRDELLVYLPSNMLPQQVISLATWPLNSHGKINHQALLHLLADSDNNTLRTPRNPTEAQLLTLWQSCLGKTAISIDDNFFEIGGDSLSAITLLRKIEQHFSTVIPVATVFNAQTIAQLALVIDQPQANFNESTEWSPLVCLRKGSPNNPPIFAFHGLGATVLSYHKMSKNLADNQAFYALQAYGLEQGQQAFTHLAPMLDYYIKAILTQQKSGPYKLIGHSFGGIVAYEVAQRLLAMGYEVSYLGLIDTHMPKPLMSRLANKNMMLKALAEYHLSPHLGPLNIPLSLLKSNQYAQLVAWIEEKSQQRISSDWLSRAIEVMEGFKQMMLDYQAQPIAINLDFYQPTKKPKHLLSSIHGQPHKAWQPLAKQINIINIEGDHHSMLDTLMLPKNID